MLPRRQLALLPCSILLSLCCTTSFGCDEARPIEDGATSQDAGIIQIQDDGSGVAPDMREGSPDQDTPRADMPAELKDQGSTAPFGARELFAQFSTLETIAGTAKISDKAENGWKQNFEGGQAIDAELSRPHIALADSKGNVFIADKDAHAIRKVSTDGIITTVAGTNIAGNDGDGPAAASASKLSSPNGIWISSTDVLYIYDLGNDRVMRVGQDGMMQTLFKVGGSGNGRGLWVSEDETTAYISAGSTLKMWKKGEGVRELASGFTSLANLHVSPSGQLAVTDRDASRAYLISPTGEKTHIAGTGSGSDAEDGMSPLDAGLDEVRGIWFHPQGGYFLTTHKGGKVWYVDVDDKMHRFIHGDKDDDHAGDGEHFDTPGKKISEPRAVTMTPQGDVLITEHDGGYIRRVRRK